jgi:hypothetical protein
VKLIVREDHHTFELGDRTIKGAHKLHPTRGPKRQGGESARWRFGLVWGLSGVPRAAAQTSIVPASTRDVKPR